MSEIDNTLSTVISMLPFDLYESKPGLTPKEYHIQAKGNFDFSMNIIPGNVFYFINPDPLSDAKEVKQIPVPVPSMELAQSIINDYVSTLLAVSPPDAVPGLFAVRGNYSSHKEVITKFPVEFSFYKKAQINWFIALTNIADDAWSKSRTPIAISDIQRSACRELGYERDWLNDIPAELQTKCPFCLNPINTGAVKCLTCNEIIDKKRYQELVGAK